MLPGLLVAGCALLAAAAPPSSGTIAGTVVNASADHRPVPRAEVVLCVDREGAFVPAGQTVTDAYGRFQFTGLPLESDRLYLPGANRDGVHYPGPRVRLSLLEPRATVRLVVYDAVSAPNPLVVRKHEVAICPAPDAVRVTESLSVENPTLSCYVGQATAEGGEPVTLGLAVPMDFERATFRKEFFGQRFWVGDDKLVTGIPWPPGTREIEFTYILPRTPRHYRWERPIDLPCSEFRVVVRSDAPVEVSSNLCREDPQREGEVVFHAKGPLRPGDRVYVTMGRLPMPAMAYARWIALGVLALGIVAGSVAATRRRTGRNAQRPGGSAGAIGSAPAPKGGALRRARTKV